MATVNRKIIFTDVPNFPGSTPPVTQAIVKLFQTNGDATGLQALGPYVNPFVYTIEGVPAGDYIERAFAVDANGALVGNTRDTSISVSEPVSRPQPSGSAAA